MTEPFTFAFPAFLAVSIALRDDAATPAPEPLYARYSPSYGSRPPANLRIIYPEGC